MKYDPEIHHRRSIRLRAHDYSRPGAYFVTICAHEKRHLFGQVIEGEMRRNALGEIVELHWRDLPRHYPAVRLDAFVVMPNHAHAIIEIVGAIHESPQHEIATVPPVRAIHELPQREIATAPPVRAIRELPLRMQRRGMALAKIVGRFKMSTAKHINETRGTPIAAVWQRNYYEHVVRNERELQMIREYVTTNPLRWDTDPENV